MLARAAARRTAGRCPNEAVAGVFRAGDVGLPRARAAAAHRLSRARRARSRTPPWPSTSASSSKPCPARRSTRCSARPRAGRPTTRSCRSRTPPRARSAARSTSCARRRSRSAARSSCAIRQNLLSNAGDRRRRDQGLFARAVARAMRAVARAASARRAARRGGEQRRGGAPRRGRARRGGDRRRERRARSTGSPMLAPHIEDEPNNTTRFWVLGRQQVAAVRARRDLARDVGARTGPGAVHEPARAVRDARRHRCRASNRGRRAPGCGSTCSSSTSSGHATDPPVAAALAELAREGAVPQAAGIVSCSRLLGPP